MAEQATRRPPPPHTSGFNLKLSMSQALAASSSYDVDGDAYQASHYSRMNPMLRLSESILQPPPPPLQPSFGIPKPPSFNDPRYSALNARLDASLLFDLGKPRPRPSMPPPLWNLPLPERQTPMAPRPVQQMQSLHSNPSVPEEALILQRMRFLG